MLFSEIHKCLPLAYSLSFFISLLISVLMTYALIKILPKLGIMDKPEERKIHLKPVPRMGGLAIYTAFVYPMLMLHYFDNTQKGIILGGGIALIIGMIDDIRGVPAVIKLITLFLLTLLLGKFGVRSNLPFHLIGIDNFLGNTIVSLFWIAGVTSAINAIDHMDGLATGVSLIASLAYLCVSLQTANFFWGLVSVSLAGSLLGFLIFNWNPAKIFMGDSGSFFLGFTLASTGLMGGWSSSPLKASSIPILILFIPIADLAYVIISRYLNKTTHSILESIRYCGKDHIGHRLMSLGFSQKYSALIVYLLCALVSISSLTIRNVSIYEAILLYLQIILILILFSLIFKRKTIP